MTPTLKKLLDYKAKEPDYVLTAFQYADEYADGLFKRGVAYGFALGIIATLIIAVVVINI